MGLVKKLAVVGLALCAFTSVDAQKATSSTSKPAATSGAPLLTVSGTYDFVKTTLFLSSDLAIFSVGSIVSFINDQLPPDMQKQVLDLYDDASSQFDTLRIQNGVPTFSSMKKDALREWEKTAQPPIDGLWKQMKKYSETPNKILKNVVVRFEKEYPASKGLLATDIFDFALIVLFIIYYVADFVLNAFCYIFCCGMCAKRKAKGTPSAVSGGKTTTQLANKNKKKN